METKMIFLDLDGTLLNDEKQLPQENRAAIDEALAAGHKVLICTGRALSSALKQAPVLGLDRPGCYAITYNGGLIYDIGAKKTIFEKTLPADDVRYIFQKAEEFGGIHIQTYADHQVISEHDTPEGRKYGRINGMEFRVVEDVIEALGGQEPCKMLAIAYGYDRQRLEAFRESLPERAKERMDICFSSFEYLEFIPKGISKGSAIRLMSEYLGIPMCNTVAVGDAENDIPMIRAAAVGAVMQNASGEVKKYGDYITQKNNNEGGAAEVIRKFLLGE